MTWHVMEMAKKQINSTAAKKIRRRPTTTDDEKAMEQSIGSAQLLDNNPLSGSVQPGSSHIIYIPVMVMVVVSSFVL
jgi:hypothetical protein